MSHVAFQIEAFQNDAFQVLAVQYNMPIVISTPMTESYQTGGAAPNALAIFPRVIFWDNPGAAGHKVTIKSSSTGIVLFEATAKARYDSQYFIPTRIRKSPRGGVKWLDFIVTQMDSGQLLIWYST